MTTKNMEDLLPSYEAYLREKELSEKSRMKYTKDVACFLQSLPVDGNLKKEWVISYKKYLMENYRPVSVNSYLMSVNRYLRYIGAEDCTVKTEKLQRRYSLDQILTLEDYNRLLFYAEGHGKRKYYCIMRTLAGTGIRIGELKYITCEAVNKKMAVIHHKGKVREIYLPDRLCVLLSEYMEQEGIVTSSIFCGWTRGKAVDVSGVWKGLKRMAVKAGVNPERVYPHSFRHLFARIYMKEIGNLAELSDILGHSSIETTRIYTMGTAEEKRASLDRMDL